MPRDNNGNYKLPPGNPVAPETIIRTDWANPTMNDLAAAITDSLSRTGAGGMLVPFQNADGTFSQPGITWTNQRDMGIYRKTSNRMGVSVQAADVFTISFGGIQMSATKRITVPDGNAGTQVVNANDLADYTNEFYVPLSSKGQPLGVASLNSSGTIPANQLSIHSTNYQGAWDASGGTLPPNPENGDVWNISVGGTINVVPPGGTTPTPTLVVPGQIILYATAEGYWYVSDNGTVLLDARYLQLTGGAMTGQLTLPGGGVGLEAATLNDIDDAITDHVNATDPHPQYLTEAEGDALYDPLGAGTLDHSALFNLAADDHQQYYNTTRGDARYEVLTDKNVPNGYAPLDASNLVPMNNLPVVNLSFYGGWDAAPGILPANPIGGEFYIINNPGTLTVVPADGSSPTPVPTLMDEGDYLMYSDRSSYWYQHSPSFAAADLRYLQLTGGELTGQLDMEANTNVFGAPSGVIRGWLNNNAGYAYVSHLIGGGNGIRFNATEVDLIFGGVNALRVTSATDLELNTNMNLWWNSKTLYIQGTSVGLSFGSNLGLGMRLTPSGQFEMANPAINSNSLPALKSSGFGWSPANGNWRAIVLGRADGTPQAIAFNYDPINNLGGSFAGGELVFKNGQSFITPNDADTAWNPLNLVLKDGNISVGTGTPDRYAQGGRHITVCNAAVANSSQHLNAIATGSAPALVQFGGGAASGSSTAVLRAAITADVNSNLNFNVNPTNSGQSVTQRMSLTPSGKLILGASGQQTGLLNVYQTTLGDLATFGANAANKALAINADTWRNSAGALMRLRTTFGTSAIAIETVGGQLLLDNNGAAYLMPAGFTPFDLSPQRTRFSIGTTQTAIQGDTGLSTPALEMVNNLFVDGASQWKRVFDGSGTQYELTGGVGIPPVHQWFNVPDGEAGVAVSPTKVMELDENGNLWVKGAPPGTWYGEVKMIVPNVIPPVGSGLVVGEGQLLNRADYPGCWAAVSGNAITDAAWLAAQNGGNNGVNQFSDGDGSTTFRIPDLRGEFLRGYTTLTNRDPHQPVRGLAWQADMFARHTHAQPAGPGNASGAAGVGHFLLNGAGITGITGGDETRPRNLNVTYYIYVGGIY